MPDRRIKDVGEFVVGCLNASKVGLRRILGATARNAEPRFPEVAALEEELSDHLRLNFIGADMDGRLLLYYSVMPSVNSDSPAVHRLRSVFLEPDFDFRLVEKEKYGSRHQCFGPDYHVEVMWNRLNIPSQGKHVDLYHRVLNSTNSPMCVLREEFVHVGQMERVDFLRDVQLTGITLAPGESMSCVVRVYFSAKARGFEKYDMVRNLCWDGLSGIDFFGVVDVKKIGMKRIVCYSRKATIETHLSVYAPFH